MPGSARTLRQKMATACTRRLLSLFPENPSLLARMGSHELQMGNIEAGIQYLRRALQHGTHAPGIHFELGQGLERLGRMDEALQCYNTALEQRPDCAETYNRRACVLRALGRLDEALHSSERAVALNPRHANAHNNLGNVLRDLNRLEQALASYDQALAIDPNLVVTHINRGNILQELKQFDAALASHDRAIALKPDFADAYCNRGVALQELNRLNLAIESYSQAIAIEPDHADAHFYKAMALLLQGDFTNGWKLYEWRWRLPDRSPHSFAVPLWLGKENLRGKSILLHAEQGLGDTIQFCRYARLVANLGAKVTLAVQAPLRQLLTNLDGVAAVVGPGESIRDIIDYHCPLMSLPLALNTTQDTIPVATPYIRSDPAKVLWWKERMGSRGKPRVGLVWSGGFRLDQPELWDVNNRRNLPIDELRALQGLDMEFYSLQKGEPAESEFAQKVANGWDGPHIINHASDLVDFSDTAALIENLDLIVSVDTSTAHLAAALGKPVWILNRFDTCWRWLLDRTDSPWYPTVKLYRQQQYGNWSGVMEHVAKDLSTFGATLRQH